jgi:hypothetical protein
MVGECIEHRGRLEWSQPAGTATCGDGHFAEEIPAAQFDTNVLGCLGDEGEDASCDGDSFCLPQAGGTDFERATACIYREGTHDCPGDYPERMVLFQSIDDTRDCSECSCTMEGTLGCEATFELHFGSTCGDATPTLQTLDDPNESFCGNDNLQPAALFLGTEARGDVACRAGTSAPQGSASEADPVTVCCLDP